MSREKKEKPKDGGIPRWFVTYSDVITLLMTFFILLLTFASNEPEGFEIMQESVFGTGGSSGNVGMKSNNADNDTLVMRTKPPSSRLTTHGSEMPPMYTDPVTEAASRGLTALDENNDLANFRRFSMDISINLYGDTNDEPTEIALHHLQMIAVQMKRLPLELTMTVASPEQLRIVAKFAEILTTRLEVPDGRVAIAVGSNADSVPQGLRLTLRHEM